MTSNILAIALLPEFAGLDKDALAVYFVMRADIEMGLTTTSQQYSVSGQYVSGLSVQSIAQKTGLVLLVADRAIDQLVSLTWVKRMSAKGDTLYNLGSEAGGWLAGQPKEVKPRSSGIAAKMKAMLEEKLARKEAVTDLRLAKSVKVKLTEGVFDELIPKEKGKSKAVIDYFRDRFKTKFGHSPASIEAGSFKSAPARMYVYAGRLLDHVGGDDARIRAVFDFAIDNWEDLKSHMKLTGELSFNIVSTKGFFNQIEKYSRKGFPKRDTAVSDRADSTAIDSAKDIGW